MASSTDRDSKDNETSASKSNADNPFIKFRKLADEQIGSLLQGIVGLPSAFAKNPVGNARWTDFDDDLKRRDELQARQRKLRESEARRGQDKVEEPSQQSDGVAAAKPYFPRNISQGREIPLYAPVSKKLFAHLLPAGFEPQWKAYNEVLKGHAIEVFRGDYFPFKIQEDQEPRSDMEALQLMAYNELDGSSTFRSDYSVLPYLLFSPYSPIRLRVEGHQQHRNPNSIIDNFPYEAAFEDLLRTSQGNIGSPWPRSIRAYPPFSGMSILGGQRSVLAWMAWIHDLYGENMLQQREIRDLPRLADMIPSDAFAAQKAKSSQQEEETAQTEQDMYDRFLQWASSPAAVVSALDSLCADTEGFIEKQLKALNSPDAKKKLKDIVESGVKDTSFEKDFQAIYEMLETALDRKQGTIFPEKSTSENLSRTTHDPEKIVSTSTTTSHTTNEDGSVETEVTVWKRFADGRETTTTTTHFEDGSNDRVQKSDSVAAEQGGGAKKGNQKGWFWN